MTKKQRQKLDQLADELRRPRGTLPIKGESNGHVFTEVDGVTVIITKKSYNPEGGYKVPALRSYPELGKPTNLEAAVKARTYFDDQAPDPTFDTGHLGPIVRPTDLKCGNRACRCSTEATDRLRHRAGLP